MIIFFFKKRIRSGSWIQVSQNVLDALIVSLKTCKNPFHNAKVKVCPKLLVGRKKKNQVQPKLHIDQKQVLHRLMREIILFYIYIIHDLSD